MFKIFFILFFILVTLEVKSQSSAYNDFLPLQTGNIWVYQCSTSGGFCGYCSGRTSILITGDTVINGKKYFKTQSATRTISGFCNSCGTTLVLPFGIVRVDSLNGNVYQNTAAACQYSPFEAMLDSLNADLGDSIRISCQPPNQWYAYICTDTGSVNVFGLSRQSRSYENDGFEGGHSRRYAKGIGVYSATFFNIEGGTMGCNRYMTLLGCVINGIVYGDTNMLVGISQISTEVPEHFSLSQNYPNPFNPVTHIVFLIAETGSVKLIIYDALGREIETVVDQKLSPGSYEADFEGSMLPSGVYYYKLEAGSFSETKKMVLLK